MTHRMRELKLAADTQQGWLDAVLGDFPEFLSDHAACEKKASGMALSLASHYPDRADLLTAMADLAVEELSHYREVIGLICNAGLVPAADRKDAYVNALRLEIRTGPEVYLTDRLLVAAVIERRGHERFCLIADALKDPELKLFYTRIARSEERHWRLFLDLAIRHTDAPIEARLDALVQREANIVASLEFGPALH